MHCLWKINTDTLCENALGELFSLMYVLSLEFHVSCLGCELRGKIIHVTLSAYNPFHAKILNLLGPLCVYIWEIGIAGILLLFRYCPHLKTFTPKLGGKSGVKPHCDSLMLGESPASLIGCIPAYFLLLKGGWGLELGPFYLEAELSDWGVWDEGSPLCISSLYPFWYSGSI